MTSTPAAFDAGRPRLSGPIRRIARPLGPIAPRSRARAGSRCGRSSATLAGPRGNRTRRPVVALRTPGGFLIPLPFGDATQWAKNVFAARGGSPRFAGHDHRLIDPCVIDRDAAARHLPPLVRFLGRRLGLRQYVSVRRVPVVPTR